MARRGFLQASTVGGLAAIAATGNAQPPSEPTEAASRETLTREDLIRFRLLADKCARSKELMKAATVEDLFSGSSTTDFKSILKTGRDNYDWTGDSDEAAAKGTLQALIDSLPKYLQYRQLLLEPWPAGYANAIKITTDSFGRYFDPGYGKYKDALGAGTDRTQARLSRLPHRGIAKDLIDGWHGAIGFLELFRGKTVIQVLDDTLPAGEEVNPWKRHIVDLCKSYCLIGLFPPRKFVSGKSILVNNKCAKWTSAGWSCEDADGSYCGSNPAGGGSDECEP